MLRMTDTFGLNSLMVSSWKLETSVTMQVSSSASFARAEEGRPMLPTTSVLRPAALKISPVRAVVVVLPLVPVMA